MRIFLLFIITSIFYSSCKIKETQPPKANIPAPLKEESFSDISLSKRGPDDLVESLYNELKNKNPQLKALADLIDGMPDRKTDSLQDFLNFQAKNENYYSSAERHLQAITDSSLKKSLKELIDASIKTYEVEVKPQKTLIKIINDKNTRLADLYNVLKVTRTLPIINQYQTSNKIASSSLKSIVNQYDSIILNTERLIKN